MFNRHGFPRLVVAALAVLVAACTMITGAARSAETPTTAATATTKPAKVQKTYKERRAEDGPWAAGANWLQFGAGYARAGGKSAGDGLGGYGVAYHHMLDGKWSFGASIRHEILGHLGDSYEIAVPFTAEFVRHYKWKTVLRPYTGIGGGYYFHKYYRTQSDYTGAPGAGWHLCTGANLPIDGRHVLGLDTRVGFVAGRGESVVNPVFGPEQDTQAQWSIKLNWAMVY